MVSGEYGLWWWAEDTSAKFEVASSLWVQAGIGLRTEYLQLCAEKFAATAREIDFSSPSAKEEINAWARESIQGTIPVLLSDLQDDNLAVLANAMHFLCHWKSRFQPELTSDRAFECVEGIKRVPMMKRTEDFGYGETDQLQWTWLPYKDPRFAMYLFLPKPGQSFAASVKAPVGLEFDILARLS